METYILKGSKLDQSALFRRARSSLRGSGPPPTNSEVWMSSLGTNLPTSAGSWKTKATEQDAPRDTRQGTPEISKLPRKPEGAEEETHSPSQPVCLGETPASKHWILMITMKWWREKQEQKQKGKGERGKEKKELPQHRAGGGTRSADLVLSNSH